MLTMEEIFIATFIGVIIAGAALGFLIYWLFEKDNNTDE